KMIDLSNYTTIFKDLQHFFSAGIILKTRSIPKSLNLKSLPVFHCGSYQYSIVESIEDFPRLSGIFNLDNKVKQLLEKDYADNFGFLVCIIDKSAEYSPIAYITDIVDNQLFIPT